MNKGDTLHGNANQALLKDDFLLSQNGRYQLYLQQDGNLVLYDLGNAHKALWASNTAGKAVSQAVMQSDGNFVIYGFPGAIWASNTAGKGNCFLTMQNDGNIVIYEIAAPVWASNTVQ